MSYDWADAAYDEAMDSLYKDFSDSALEGGEIYDRIVEDFQELRLREFYLDHPGVTEVAKSALTEAQELQKITPRCSVILAATSSEVCIREALLIPILHGSFHSKSSGDLMAAIIATERNERLTRALVPIFARHTGIDLRTFKRSGSTTNLGQEVSETQSMRNKIVHQGKNANNRQAICPQGKLSPQCSCIKDSYLGTEYYRIEWGNQCDRCPVQKQCTHSRNGRRTLVVGLRHDLVQQRRKEMQQAEFSKRMHPRNGIDGTHSELVRALSIPQRSDQLTNKYMVLGIGGCFSDQPASATHHNPTRATSRLLAALSHQPR